MWRIATMVLAMSTGLWAQAVTAFDVASVRLIPQDEGGLMSISPQGSPSFIAKNVTMEILAAMAFGVDSDRIAGPSWIGSQKYDVSAKWEGEAKLSYEELRAPLDKLLAERFQLAAHKEKKERSGFALVAAKNGPQLIATKGGTQSAYILKNGIRVTNGSLDALAGTLTRPAHAPVVNETGIAGNFDIRLDYAPEGDLNSNLPSFITALQEQLGLKLVSRKVPVDVLVIDKLERVPAEN